MVFIATVTFAQTDTVFTTLAEERGTLEPQQFMSEYDRAFEAMTPAKWMFKMDWANMLHYILNKPGINLSAETKLGPSISIAANYQVSLPVEITNVELTDRTTPTRYSTTLRWYYNMKKRIAAGKSASNFSGNYVALESALLPAKRYNTFEVLAKFGVQRRLLGFGYFDLSYGIGGQYVPSTVYTRKGWYFSSQPRLAIGPALFTPRRNNMPTTAACDVLRCFQESRRMFKIDLYHLIGVGEISNRLTNLSLNPSFAYEHKIGKSPFSAELSAAGTGRISRYKSDVFNPYKARQIGATGMAELRWYFLQKKRILQGKSGNNLSGAFFGLHAAHSIGRSHFENSEFNFNGTYAATTTRAIVGMQHRILDHGFVQFKIGAGSSWRKDKYTHQDGRMENGKRGPEIDYFAELKAGLAF